MATEKTTEKTTTDMNARAMQALAGRFRREIAQAHARAYRRATRTFAKDAGCTEQQAKEWLKDIGVSEPPAVNGK